MNWRLSHDRAAVQPSQIAERADLLCDYGLHQLAQRQYGEAAASFGRVVSIEPNHALAWYHRGDALANLKRYGESLESFERSLNLDPDSHAAWTFHGVVLIHLCRYAEAVKSCDRALALCPHFSEALMFRGAALQHLGEYRLAYASYDLAAEIERLSPWGWLKSLAARVSQRFIDVL
jgi:tetratricopeptide (TPR) repeat protein